MQPDVTAAYTLNELPRTPLKHVVPHTESTWGPQETGRMDLERSEENEEGTVSLNDRVGEQAFLARVVVLLSR